MSDTAASLQRKIASAAELESVVRTMKAMAASSIGQYEKAVRSLDEYYRTVQLGLCACFRQDTQGEAPETAATGAVVFGSDQGLVGQFNEQILGFVEAQLQNLPGKKTVWAVGNRIQSRLCDTDLQQGVSFILPNSITAITPLIGQLLLEIESQLANGGITQFYLFHNRPEKGAIYQPVSQRLLPLDAVWRKDLTALYWPSNNLPQVLNDPEQTRGSFVREYLFVSLFRACAESLSSENASRLAAMQRAEKNIDELLEDLQRNFHRLRQNNIDAELFDVVSGFEAFNAP